MLINKAINAAGGAAAAEAEASNTSGGRRCCWSGAGFFFFTFAFFSLSNHHLISFMPRLKKTEWNVMKSQFGPDGEKRTTRLGRGRRQTVDTVSHK